MCNITCRDVQKVDSLTCEVSDTTSTLSVPLILFLGCAFDAYENKNKLINIYV